jgi:hypothetical protein
MADATLTLGDWAPHAEVGVYHEAAEEPRRVRGDAPITDPLANRARGPRRRADIARERYVSGL